MHSLPMPSWATAPQLCDAKTIRALEKRKASVSENRREFIDNLKAQFIFYSRHEGNPPNNRQNKSSCFTVHTYCRKAQFAKIVISISFRRNSIQYWVSSYQVRASPMIWENSQNSDAKCIKKNSHPPILGSYIYEHNRLETKRLYI
jgi:hypothetical protein